MEIHRSAYKHGLDDGEILHAIGHAVTVIDLEPEADPPKVLAIGPDTAGNLLEIIWLELARGVADRDPRHGPAPGVLGPAVGSGGGASMSSADVRRTRSGRVLTEEELDALAAEVEKTEYDVEALKERRRGRPAMGSGPADVVPVRLAPEMRAAIEVRAAAEDTTTSEIIREALRRFLEVA